MFQHIQQYREQLINFLYEINGNIDWNDFINKNMSIPPNKLLSKIKSLIWIDKDLSYDNGMQQNIKLFSYYTSLLNKYYKIITLPDITVYIINVAEGNDKSTSLDDFIIDEVKQKLNVLCRLLKLMRIKFELVTSLNKDSKIVIPTCSITYNNPNELLKSFSGIMIIDNYYNIYKHEEDKELNFFKLSITQLSKNPEIKIPEIMDQKYGFLKLIIKTT